MIIAIEDKFDIGIDDQEAQRIATPAQLIDHITSKVSINRSIHSCMTQKAFHLLRQKFLSLSSGKRNDFKPDRAIRGLLPTHAKRKFLASWAKEMEMQWIPGLSMITWGGIGLVAVPAALIGVVQVLMDNVGISIAVGLGPLIVVGLLTQNLHGLGIIRVGGTVDSVVRGLVAEYPGRFRISKETWTQDEVRETVRAIITQIMGITEFKDEDRFVEDMGLD